MHLNVALNKLLMAKMHGHYSWNALCIMIYQVQIHHTFWGR